MNIGKRALKGFIETRRGSPLVGAEDLSGRIRPQHYYVSKADAALMYGWQQGAYPVIRLAAGEIPWDSSRELSRSWSFNLHSWDQLDELLLAYTHVPEQRYLDRAVEIALDWAGRFTQHEDESSFAWYDMAVGLRAARLGFILDAYARTEPVDSAALAVLLKLALRHGDILADDSFIRFHNNHGFYQAAGQAALARRFPELPGMAGALAQAQERLGRMISQQFTDEGIHREHSPGYHRNVYGALRALARAGLINEPRLLRLCRRIEDALAWMVYPDGVLVNFGDTDAQPLSECAGTARQEWMMPAMRWIASAGAAGAPPPQDWRCFPESGYFVVKDWARAPAGRGAEYLAFNAAFHSRAHKHADELSYVFFCAGGPLLVDAGRYGYLQKTRPGDGLWEDGFWYAAPERIFVESTRAHNAVEIDGRSYQRRGREPFGSAITWGGRSGEIYAVEAEVLHFDTICHHRALVYFPGAWLLVLDWLDDSDGAEHAFGVWNQFHPDITLTAGGHGFRCERDGAFVAELTNLASGGTFQGPFCGVREPDMLGWYSPTEGEIEPAAAVVFRASGPSLQSATLVSLRPGVCAQANGRSFQAADGRVDCAWRDARAEWTVAYRREGAARPDISVRQRRQ